MCTHRQFIAESHAEGYNAVDTFDTFADWHCQWMVDYNVDQATCLLLLFGRFMCKTEGYIVYRTEKYSSCFMGSVPDSISGRGFVATRVLLLSPGEGLPSLRPSLLLHPKVAWLPHSPLLRWQFRLSVGLSFCPSVCRRAWSMSKQRNFCRNCWHQSHVPDLSMFELLETKETHAMTVQFPVINSSGKVQNGVPSPLVAVPPPQIGVLPP